MSARTRLYLDVDGVINARYAGEVWNGSEAEGVASTNGRPYRIVWSPEMIEGLRSLDAEIVWCTTWRDDAVRHIAPLIGLGHDFRIIHPNLDPEALTTFPSIRWKLRAVQMDQEADPSPFIWADDELWSAPGIADAGRMMGGMVAGPDPHHGLTPDHIQAMHEYITVHKADGEK